MPLFVISDHRVTMLNMIKRWVFVFFNNIAVGVAHALEHYHLERVAIVDFDVHHGNGTEDIIKIMLKFYCALPSNILFIRSAVRKHKIVIYSIFRYLLVRMEKLFVRKWRAIG